jgi:hypothetical protein
MLSKKPARELQASFALSPQSNSTREKLRSHHERVDEEASLERGWQHVTETCWAVRFSGRPQFQTAKQQNKKARRGVWRVQEIKSQWVLKSTLQVCHAGASTLETENMLPETLCRERNKNGIEY